MKKISKKLALGLLVPSLIAPVAVLASCNVTNDSMENNLNSNLANSNSNMKFLFNGKYYDSLDDITNELVNNNKFINSDLYYGNASEAIFDHETNRLNINKLRKYDSSRINPAYLNAFGGYEQDFMKAKRSFVNEGLVKYKYQDTQGKLHSSFSEAKRAILNGVKVDETVFYQIKDQSDNNKVYKINPLNKDDINLMKRIAINNAKYAVNDPTKSEFNIMPMIRDEQGNYNILSSNNPNTLLNIMFSKSINDVYNTISTKLQAAYAKAIEKVLKSDAAIFKSNVKFKYNSDGGHQLSYDLKSFKGDHNNFHQDWDVMTIKDTQHIRTNELIFNNISYKELDHLNVFLDRGTWNKPLKNTDNISSSIESKVTRSTQYTIRGYEKADTLKFQNFLGTSFTLFSSAYDGTSTKGDAGNYNRYYPLFDDGYWGINTQILQPGVFDGAQLSFDVKFSLNKPKQFRNGVETMMLEDIKGMFSDKLHEKEIEENLIGSIIDRFMDVQDKNIARAFDEKNYNYKGNGNDLKRINGLSDIVQKLNDESIQYFVLEKQKIIENFFHIYKNTNTQGKKDKNRIRYVFTYNKSAIFSIEHEINKIDTSNYSKKLYELILDSQNFNTDNSKFNYDILSNISNLISDDGKQIIDKKYLVKTTLDKQGYFTIPKEISEYQGTLNGNVGSPMPDLPNLYFALNSYNQNLKRLRTRYPESTLAIIKGKFVVNPNDILVLRGEPPKGSSNPSLHQILTTYYGEYVSLAYDFNESAVNNNKIVYDKVTLDTTKKANSTIEPAKVIVVYDLSGNVINPGIVLTEDLVVQTTSDAMYDSERTILDNIYRTLIIKRSPNKIFYLNEDKKTYTLLDYQTNFIYKLEYDKKTHYFLTYQHAWLYLRAIIALEAQRVNIKG